MSDVERTEEEQAAHDKMVAEIVEQWGDSFRALVDHPRVTFDGEFVVIRLWKPIKVTGEEAGELRFREPTIAELKKLDVIRGSVAQAQSLIINCAAVTERETNAIGMRDLTIIGHLVSAFTGAAPATGSTSSAI